MINKPNPPPPPKKNPPKPPNIVVTSDRQQKVSKNPLADYNQYNVLEELLQGQEEMEFEIGETLDSEFSSQGIIKPSNRKLSIGIVEV